LRWASEGKEKYVGY
jgi:hypothetical protein